MVRCCKAFLQLFKDQSVERTYADGGMRIFNLTSVAGLVTMGIGMSAYAASKHAANAFSSILRVELKGFGIQVMTINPSFHGTPLVTKMQDVSSKQWGKLDMRKKEEYGQGTFGCAVIIDAVAAPLETYLYFLHLCLRNSALHSLLQTLHRIDCRYSPTYNVEGRCGRTRSYKEPQDETYDS